MIHLHLHSHYSVLDGLGKPADIIARAKEIGASAVAITDHASISSMPEFFKLAKETNIKPIIGCEFYVVDDVRDEVKKEQKRYHLTVLAKTWKGVQSIMSHLATASRQAYYRPRLSFEQCLDFEDCVVMSACSIGILSCEDWFEKALKMRNTYRDDFYLEIMPHEVITKEKVEIQSIANKRAISTAEKLKAKLVATNDAHYVRKEDYETHCVLMCVQYNKSALEPSDWPSVYYMRSVAEMVHAFKKHCDYIPHDVIRDSILNTKEVADKCNIEMPEFEVHLPKAYDGDDDAIFGKKVMDGWKELVATKAVDLAFGKLGMIEYANRLKYEISVIKKLGFVRYFLIVEDFISWARKNGIRVGPARGSAAGSLVCYLLGITQVDPIRHGLFFERFLNPERIDLPDIDVDFQDDRRHEVFAYVRNKYGMEMTAKINTFGKLSPKSAFKDVARAFGISPLRSNTLSKQIEGRESFEEVPDLVKFATERPEIVKFTLALDGTIRQQGVHACGLIVANRPLNDVSVIEHRKDSGGDDFTDVVNWDKRECENFGLLKIDILGLKTLSVIDRTLELIKERHGIDLDLVSLPLDDRKTFESFKEGKGVGVFQFENGGMQSLLRSLEASDFETITDTTALFRPGSLNSGQTARYVKIARGEEYENYLHPKLESILSPTRGVMVYQEQIMRIFNELGGFSWAEADKMRKIIGKKLGKDEFEKHRAHFTEGCKANGVDESIASELFDGMVEFAAYSFNKSHAVAYTMISYWCMYLKVHYTPEFVCGYMQASDDDKVQEMVTEARNMGIKIKEPDINISTNRYEIDERDIVPPLGIIKGVGSKAVDDILEARKTGPFLSVDDMQNRVTKRLVHKGVVDKLQRAGAFTCFGIVEPDLEKREKDYAELLPTFNSIPQLTLKDEPMDKAALRVFVQKYSECCADKAGLLDPYFTRKMAPSIMVVNSPVKGESKNLTKPGTKYFMKVVKDLGFTEDDFYYTSPIKCVHSIPNEVTKACQGTCMDFLREEIRIVKPKLIICFSTMAISTFVSGKVNMAKLNGKVVFNKDYDCYVMFSYSPQYAHYQEDKVGDAFLDNMYMLRKIF